LALGILNIYNIGIIDFTINLIIKSMLVKKKNNEDIIKGNEITNKKEC